MPHPAARLAWLIPPILAAAAGDARAQGLEFVQAAYEKSEVRIPMRDGTKLFTAIYAPKDRSRRYPILMMRTPYSVAPYGDDFKSDLGPNPLFGTAGYIFVYQDVRGAYMSEGEFVNMRPIIPRKGGPKDIDESSDTYDTIDWLIENIPNHNGRVGTWGISYPGFYTAAGMIDAHPALKAASPQAPINDWFVGDDFHHNGVLFLPHAFNFLARFGHPRPVPTTTRGVPFRHGTPDGYDFFLRMGPLANADRLYFKGDVPFWDEMLRHDTYDDFWKERNLRPHLKEIKPAVMTVGGWFDAENLFGALETYKNVEANRPKSTNVLVMGPWYHGAWARSDGDRLGPIEFGSKTAEYYRNHIEFPFFEHHLKGEGDWPQPEAWVFETGSNRWQQHDAWPPPKARAISLHFAEGGRLSREAPGGDPGARDEYVSDPARPVPFQDEINIGMDPQYMVEDQRFAARRTDVLTYQTEPLEEDLVLAGPIKADLFVSTSGTDSDWVVKLIDVYPGDAPDPIPNPANIRMGNYQQLVRGEIFRGKFRKGYDRPEPFAPDVPDRVAFALPDINHSFRKGHRVMVQVHSTWFPLADRNPQTFTAINEAEAPAFRKAVQRVYRGGERSSRLEVMAVPNPEPQPMPVGETN